MNPYVSVELTCWYTWKIINQYKADPDLFWKTFQFEYVDKGVQAVVGRLEATDDSLLHTRNLRCIVKLTQTESNLIYLEYQVLRELGVKLAWFPHIPRCYGLIDYKSYIDPSQGMFIEDTRQKYVMRQALLLEEVTYLGHFSTIITSKSTRIVVAILKQIFMCIRVFRSIRMTHYDLHADNILVCKCPDNLVIEYNIDGEIYLVRTYGYFPVIIDFGFSYVDITDDTQLYADLHSVCHGYLGDRFMPFSDYIRLSHSTARELGKNLNKSKSVLRKKLRQVFSPCSLINTKNGWEDTNLTEDYVDELLRCIGHIKLHLFRKVSWLRSLQMLIPARAHFLDNTTFTIKSFETFSHEWVKIEKRITNSHTLNYLFKYLVTLIPNSDAGAVKVLFLDELTRIVNSFLPANVDFEILIHAIKSMARNQSILLRRYMNRRANEMFESYIDLPFTATTVDDYMWKFLQDVYGPDEISSEDRIYPISKPTSFVK